MAHAPEPIEVNTLPPHDEAWCCRSLSGWSCWRTPTAIGGGAQRSRGGGCTAKSLTRHSLVPLMLIGICEHTGAGRVMPMVGTDSGEAIQDGALPGAFPRCAARWLSGEGIRF